jgi:DNA-binding FadR family transcriptional regulator
MVKSAALRIAKSAASRLDNQPVELVRKQVIRVPKAAELVSRELRKQIVRGEIKEGTSLVSESDMMAHFGVSRPTLREAIRILESEGLISVARGARGGAIVRRPRADVATLYVSLLLQTRGTTLADIYRVHMLVEPAAVRVLAERHKKTAPAVLRQCVAEGRDKFDNDFDYGAAAARFRNKLIELADIPTLTLLMGMLNSIFETCWAKVTAEAGRHIDNSQAKRRGLRSLERLIKLIEEGDGDAAEAHWRQHTEFANRAMGQWMAATTVIDIMDDHMLS